MLKHQDKSKLRRLLGPWLVLFLALLFFGPSPLVQAENHIQSLRIEANIQEDGSVHIRDHRNIHAEVGTEHYLSFGDLHQGNNELRNVTVYDREGQPLEEVHDWQIDASFNEKSGKYGVHQNGDFTEISFGLGDHGNLEFTIEYEITNFVFNFEDDYQGFYWRFVNPGMDPILDLEIQVTYPDGKTFTYPDVRFWAFGHEEGTTDIQEDRLVMKDGGDFSEKDYVVLLGIFEGQPFQASHQHWQTSEDLLNQAMDGATLDGMTYEEYLREQAEGQDGSGEERSGLNSILYFISNNPGTAFNIFIFAISYLYIAYRAHFAKPKSRRPKYKYRSNISRDEYYRDIPYKGLFCDTAYITGATVANTTSAFILKWVEEGRLQDTVQETGFIFKKERLALRINPQASDPDHETEAALWDIVKRAAGDDLLLEEKEFNKYVRANPERYFKYENYVELVSRNTLVKENSLEKHTYKSGLLKLFEKTDYKITVKGQALLDNIQGFKNYLRDFSLIHEREANHVVLWQDFFIWAAYLGIAEEFYEQFSIVEPEAETAVPYNRDLVILTKAFAHTVHKTAEGQRNTGSSSSSSSSSRSYSGGGGSSFSGGGSGASGGGSGGGTR